MKQHSTQLKCPCLIMASTHHPNNGRPAGRMERSSMKSRTGSGALWSTAGRLDLGKAIAFARTRAFGMGCSFDRFARYLKHTSIPQARKYLRYLYDLRVRAMTISSEQVRAARALLRWEQKDLAAASRISLPAIKRMETVRGPLAAQARTVEAIRSA